MNTLQMQIIAIVAGSFSTAGNFSGYNAAGQRIHIAGRQMESLGYTPDTIATKPVVFPLFVVAVEREFNVLDADGAPTTEKFSRLQAGSVFATKAGAIEAFNSDKVLTIEAGAELVKAAKTAGLTDAAVAALTSAAV
jgi:hypothetical protein